MSRSRHKSSSFPYSRMPRLTVRGHKPSLGCRLQVDGIQLLAIQRDPPRVPAVPDPLSSTKCLEREEPIQLIGMRVVSQHRRGRSESYFRIRAGNLLPLLLLRSQGGSFDNLLLAGAIGGGNNPLANLLGAGANQPAPAAPNQPAAAVNQPAAAAADRPKKAAA